MGKAPRPLLSSLRLHINRPDPHQTAQFHVHGLPVAAGHLLVAGQRRGESPPSGPGHGIGEDSGGIRFDHLGHEGIVGDLYAPALVEVLDLDGGERDRLAVTLHDPAEGVARPQAERPHEWLDLDGESDHGVPAFLRAR